MYAEALGTIFTEQAKPYEVELCVAEVAHFGETKPPELYRITYDGSINDEPHFVVMGGTTEPIAEKLNENYTENAGLSTAAKIAIDALKAGTNGEPRTIGRRRWRWRSWTRTGHAARSGESPAQRWKRCCPKSRPTKPSRSPRSVLTRCRVSPDEDELCELVRTFQWGEMAGVEGGVQCHVGEVGV